MRKHVTLTHEFFDDKLSKKINSNLPDFLKKKVGRDAKVYLEDLFELNSLPIACVTSYRQGFAAALEYIRARINKDIEDDKKEVDDAALAEALEERGAHFIQREDSADVREMKAMMRAEGLTLDEMSCTGLY